MTNDPGQKTGAGKPPTGRERLRQSMVDGIAGPADDGFKHSMADFSRRLGERTAHQPPRDAMAAAAARRAALKAYDEARVRRWKTALKATATVAATLCVTWLVVLIGTPSTPEPMPSSRSAATMPARVASQPALPPAASPPPVEPMPAATPETAASSVPSVNATSAAAADTARPPNPPAAISESASAEAAATASPLRREDIREVQARLRAFGFNPGPVDGNPGRATTNAAWRYQQNRALPQTGNVDRALLEQLRQDPAPQPVAQRPPRPGPRATMAPPRGSDPLDDVRAAANRVGRWIDSLVR